MSEVTSGMEDGAKENKYDKGGRNDIKLEGNKCGVVYEFDVDGDSTDACGGFEYLAYVVHHPDFGLIAGLFEQRYPCADASDFTLLDAGGLGLLLLCWIGCTIAVENAPVSRPSMSQIMARFRREWMRQFVTRQPRIYDGQIIASLRQGTAFFASASMIAIGGGFALLGNADRLRGVAQDLTLDSDPVFLLEVKLLVLLLFAANAFLKFVWSHRLFGYCAVLMAAVPNDPEDPLAVPRANKAAEINIAAARGYNRGLRSVYFGIACGAWLVGAWALMAAVAVTLLVIGRREFASHSRAVLLDPADGIRPAPL